MYKNDFKLFSIQVRDNGIIFSVNVTSLFYKLNYCISHKFWFGALLGYNNTSINSSVPRHFPDFFTVLPRGDSDLTFWVGSLLRFYFSVELISKNDRGICGKIWIVER